MDERSKIRRQAVLRQKAQKQPQQVIKPKKTPRVKTPNQVPAFRIPQIWSNATCAIFAGGPSMSQKVANACQHLKTIAINNSWELAPWADVLWVSDQRWWYWNPNASQQFTGLKLSFAMSPPDETIKRVAYRGREGIDEDPDFCMTGKNGGHAAINAAIHLGAKRILLCGYDMRDVNGKKWWHAGHPKVNAGNIYRTYAEMLATAVQPLQRLGIEVYNVTPGSALSCFQKMDLDYALRKFKR